jgi:hypothetical protein
MAAKFFTGLPLDGPDPECIRGFGEELLSGRPDDRSHLPRPGADHSRTPRPVPVTIGNRPPASACDESPLAGFAPDESAHR